MRLIDADALIAQWESDAEEMEEFAIKMATYGAINDVKRQPTIEPRKGHWIKKMKITETTKYSSYDPRWYCSYCNTEYDPAIANKINFCWNCGADMRGEQDAFN